MKKALLILTLEAPAAVTNAAIYGAILEARKSSFIEGIYGAKRGLEGLLGDDIVDLEKEEKEEIEKLPFFPGSVLLSSDVALSYNDCSAEMEVIKGVIDRLNIGYFLLIGGPKTAELSLSLSTSFLLSGIEASVLFLPTSEDNSFALSDHSLGYPSAARRLLSTLEAVAEVARSSAKSRVYLLSVEGAGNGYLTAAGYLLPPERGADLVYLRESGANYEGILKDLSDTLEAKGQAVAMADAALLESLELTSGRLSSGLGSEVVSIPLSYYHRLGPEGLSSLDLWEAESAARLAVLSFKNGESGKMASIVREKDSPYESSLTLVPLGQVVGSKREFPAEWILSSREASEELKRYLSPLVAGEVSRPASLLSSPGPNLFYKKV